MRLKDDKQGFIAVLMALFTGIIIILGISIAVSLGPAIGGPIDETAQENTPGYAYASASFTFSGNTTDGETFNISYSGTSDCYEFDPADDGVTHSGCNDVDVSSGGNTSALSAYNLATSINANDNVGVEASNSSDTISLTADNYGDDYNSISVSDTCANITTNTTLSGGEDGSQWNSTVNSDLPQGSDIWESNIDIISIAVFVVIAFGAIIGTMLWYVRRQGGM